MEQNMNMPLETEILCTYDLFKEAAKTYRKSKKKLWITIYALIAFVIVAGCVLLTIDESNVTGICGIACGVLYIPLIWFIQYLQVRKSYKSNIAMQNKTICFFSRWLTDLV